MDATRFWRTFIIIRDDYRRPVIPLLLAFAAGLLCGEPFYLPRWLSGGIAGICLAGVLWRILHRQSAVLLPLALFFFSGWFVMTGFSRPLLPPGHVSRFCGPTQWTITGLIIDEPGAGPDRRIFFVRAEHLENGRQKIRAGGNLRVTVYKNNGPELCHGMRIRFQSRIIKISNFKNPGRFDYERYMAFQKVFGLAYTDADRVEVLSDRGISGWRPAIEAVRKTIAARIEKIGDPVSVGILKALVIGYRHDLDPDMREVFARAGVSHLLAISGLHVGIVAGLVFFALFRIMAFFPFLTWPGWAKPCAAALTLPCVIGYGLLAGMSPATQRAVIMVTVFLAALVVRRRHQLMNSLALAALIILAVHPPSLYAVSFQLSFAAVFFIFLGMDAVRDLINGPENKWLKRGAGFVLVSLFAVAGTSPLAAHYFNQVCWIGPVTNCLMIPIVGFVVVPLGLGGAALHSVSPGLSLVLFKAGGHILSAAYAVMEKIAGLPFVAADVVTPNRVEIGCYYTLLWAGIMLFKHRHYFFPGLDGTRPPVMPLQIKTALALSLGAVIIMVVDAGYWVNRRFLHDDLRVTVLDVGQGNAALVELPGGRCLMIDGGGFTGSSTFDVGEMIVAPFLWRNKIGTMDTIILTHPDTDHLGGLIYIAEHFHVKSVWCTGETADTVHFRRFARVIKEKQIHVPEFAQLKKDRAVNGVRIEILYPFPGFLDQKKIHPWRNANNNSLVTRIRMGKIAFLFPGDLEEEGERELAIAMGRGLAGTFLLAPHHGSRTSSTAFFLSMVEPALVVVSSGRHNRFGCPCPGALERYAAIGADVFRTDRDGAVAMSTRGRTLRVKTPCRSNQVKAYPVLPEPLQPAR